MSEATVIGSGPNGLAAAIVLAEAGLAVTVVEGAETPGGACRSEELTLPAFVHDTCASVHALGAVSPFLGALDLDFAYPSAPLAHPLDDGTTVILERSVDDTARGLGPDADAYRRVMQPLVDHADALFDGILGPLRPPRNPLVVARFAGGALRSAFGQARAKFRGPRAQALLAGLAAHSRLSLHAPVSSAFGLVLGIAAHRGGWPVARGGSQRLTDALVARLQSHGGALETGRWVESLEELAARDLVLADLTPRQFLRIAGAQLPHRYAGRLRRYRYGPGVFKVDWALGEPIPWRAAEAATAGTVHLGGTLEEIAASEDAVVAGRHPDRPYVILVQPTLFDPSRAPEGRHTAWAYCHVPNGSQRDMAHAIEAQVERFAPGFGDRVLERSTLGPAAIEARNPNLVGGDINGGVQDLRQLFTRPVARLDPYSTPLDRVYLCSSSTPPGGGVHGMCGVWAARSALRGMG